MTDAARFLEVAPKKRLYCQSNRGASARFHSRLSLFSVNAGIRLKILKFPTGADGCISPKVRQSTFTLLLLSWNDGFGYFSRLRLKPFAHLVYVLYIIYSQPKKVNTANCCSDEKIVYQIHSEAQHKTDCCRYHGGQNRVFDASRFLFDRHKRR